MKPVTIYAILLLGIPALSLACIEGHEEKRTITIRLPESPSGQLLRGNDCYTEEEASAADTNEHNGYEGEQCRLCGYKGICFRGKCIPIVKEPTEIDVILRLPENENGELLPGNDCYTDEEASAADTNEHNGYEGEQYRLCGYKGICFRGKCIPIVKKPTEIAITRRLPENENGVLLPGNDCYSEEEASAADTNEHNGYEGEQYRLCGYKGICFRGKCIPIAKTSKQEKMIGFPDVPEDEDMDAKSSMERAQSDELEHVFPSLYSGEETSGELEPEQSDEMEHILPSLYSDEETSGVLEREQSDEFEQVLPSLYSDEDTGTFGIPTKFVYVHPSSFENERHVHGSTPVITTIRYRTVARPAKYIDHQRPHFQQNNELYPFVPSFRKPKQSQYFPTTLGTSRGLRPKFAKVPPSIIQRPLS